ncbi:NAD-dependent epimerase/dehydratase family protein [Peribacillus alkalitolerans]|uniref:NAD-dependent epimerase/dehydratase family protein n=1 Tax=Peribacillus alkalitolerans TaxID=1550385 RepID=UPI0013D40B71|nr:NAD-dependent epimerase/dehydratase family protein [Peribacillus alkalitolerans]
MKVLIIGGTRFIGPYVIKELLELGHEVSVFNRGESEYILPAEVEFIKGDRDSIENHLLEIKKCKPDVVLDMIPFTEKQAKKAQDIFSGVAGRIVGISSGDVYRAYGRLIGSEPGDTVLTPSNEESPLREKRYPFRGKFKDNHPMYDYDKILVEQVYLNNKNIPGTILRLPMVYGPGDRQHRLFEYVKRMKDDRQIILIDRTLGNWKTARAYVENVAHAITLSLINPNSANKIYNVVENNFTETKWVHLIKDHMNWVGKIEIISDHPNGLNFAQNLDMDSEKIRNELGYSEKVPFEVGLERTINWEINHYPDFDPRTFYDKDDQWIINNLSKT